MWILLTLKIMFCVLLNAKSKFFLLMNDIIHVQIVHTCMHT